jgi:DNA modification methylase
MKEYTKHPTQKPLSICDRIIQVHSNENDLVYIPFAGSGSEIVSCINNNRNYIATELNNDYIEEIIKPRINKIVN